MKLGVILEQGGSLETMRASGQEERLLYYFERYREAFSDVVFFSYGDRGETAAGAARIVPPKTSLSPSLYSFYLPWAERDELESCDVIRGLQMSAAIPAVLAKKRYGVPCAITFGYDARKLARQRLPRLNLGLARRHADVIVCTTESLRETMTKLTPRGRVELVPNGVDLQTFRPAPVRHAPEGRWKIVSVGRLSKEKNYELLIEAAVELSGVGVEVEVHLVGSGPEASRLESRANSRGVALTLLGTVPSSAVAHHLAAADVFVLCSRSEGHPKAILEAMACGRPSVGTNVPGIRDVLKDGETGLLASESAASLAKAIGALLHDRALAERLARAARAEVEQHYDLDALVTREIGLLSRLAATEPSNLGGTVP